MGVAIQFREAQGAGACALAVAIRPPVQVGMGGIDLLKAAGRSIGAAQTTQPQHISAIQVGNARRDLSKFDWIALQPQVGQGQLLFRQCIPTPPSSLRILYMYTTRLPPNTASLHHSPASTLFRMLFRSQGEGRVAIATSAPSSSHDETRGCSCLPLVAIYIGRG